MSFAARASWPAAACLGASRVLAWSSFHRVLGDGEYSVNVRPIVAFQLTPTLEHSLSKVIRNSSGIGAKEPLQVFTAASGNSPKGNPSRQ